MEEDLIQKATAAAERIEAANKVAEELIKKAEALEARKILSGSSEAGVSVPQMTEEEKNKISMKEYFKGTALEKILK